MRYRQLGKSGLKVSELCLGAMPFGSGADEKTSAAIIDRFLEAGGNFIDTADVYEVVPGQSETILGRVVKERRNSVVLATKVAFAMGTGPNETGLSRSHVMHAV